MEVIKYFKEKYRMTEGCSIDCIQCPLSFCNKRCESCSDFEMKYPIEAIKIVKEWAEKHPPKTRKEKLLECLPNTLVDDDGTPKACCKALGMTKECNFVDDGVYGCLDCWNEAYDK